MAKCSSCGRDIGFSFGKKLCRWCVDYEATKRGETSEKNQVQRVMPTPWKNTQAFSGSFNQLFIAINVLVFAAMVFKSGSLTSFPGQQLVDWGSLFGPLTMGGQPWRLITYMFLHGGIIHIGMNMWCLWQLGALAESLYDDWLYALIYLLAGIGGGLASLWWHPFTNTVGASGAVFGVAGALIAGLKLGEFSLPRPMIASTLRSVLIFSAYSLIFGAMSGGTDNACHVGGLLTGLLCGALVALVAPDRGHVGRRIVICLVVAALLLGTAKLVVNTRGFVVVAQLGSDLLERGKTAEAIDALNRAVKMRPDNPEAHFWLANAYYAGREFPKAEAELNRVLALQPNNRLAMLHLGFTRLQNHELDAAQQTFSQLAKMDASNADAHLGLALIATERGKHDVAVTEYKNAIGLGAENVSYYELALSYIKLKQYDEAIAALKKYEEDLGETYQSQVALAEAYQGKGMTAEAKAATEKAAQLKPK